MIMFQCHGRCVKLAIAIAMLLLAKTTHAGGGPENVLLVVNSANAPSVAIANYFQQLRGIPAINVVNLDWRGGDARTDIQTFREKILTPILTELEKRDLSQQIDYIVYSAGFPWNINFSADVPAGHAADQAFANPEASLTGLTYLFNPVLGRNAAAYTAMTSNRYMRLRERSGGDVREINTADGGPLPGLIPNNEDTRDGYKRVTNADDPSSIGSHGFKSWYGWGEKGQRIEAGGVRYMLSTTLGITFGRGNTATEIVNYLKVSSTADGTNPKGTIYFMDSGSGPAAVRSWTRRPGFPMAVEQLKQLGVKAEIMHEEIPIRQPNVQGLLCGVADFDWGKSGSTIRPGAICENLTSYGGIFDKTASQTPLSAFLRYGAAGTSGTVIEPFSIQNKFPHAMIQVHYARGCSLAEAFYQAVYSPYQLLIVGDPLCRPWANIPEVKVTGAKTGEVLKGKISLRPVAVLPRGGIADRFELFVDGKRVAACAQSGTLDLNTAAFPDGDHELRIVAIENTDIESQGRQIMIVRFDNYGRTIQFEISPKQKIALGEAIRLKASAPAPSAWRSTAIGK